MTSYPNANGPADSESEIQKRVLLLVECCRRAGVPIGMTELVDGFGATLATDLGDREGWRVALRCCLIKRAEHLPVFDDLFDRLFPLSSSRIGASLHATDGVRNTEEAESNTAQRVTHRDDSSGLQEAVRQAIGAGDLDVLRELANEAVEAFAGLQRGGSSEKQYLMRVTRAMDLANLMQRALRDGRSRSETGSGIEGSLVRSEVVGMVEEFRKMLAREVTRRLAELVPVETITTVKYPDDISFLDATISQRADLRSAVRPLARKLAARMAQRRRLRSTGRVDVRKTARRSLAFGGVPLEPVSRAKRATKPNLVVLCDVSGSVTEFAYFMLSLLHALHEELHRLRTYVFVDGVAEVTELFTSAEHGLEPLHLLSQPGVVTGDGHSDFGAVLESFTKKYSASVIVRSTTLIICGDARNNYREPNASALERIAEQVRAVYWLNPEPQGEWGRTDSAIDLYRPSCKAVFEVRTTRQLVAAIAEIDATA